MADPELEAIRARRMQELMAQHGMGRTSFAIPCIQNKKEILYRSRVARIVLVKPDKARGVEDVLLRAAQMGQIVEKVSEDGALLPTGADQHSNIKAAESNDSEALQCPGG